MNIKDLFKKKTATSNPTKVTMNYRDPNGKVTKKEITVQEFTELYNNQTKTLMETTFVLQKALTCFYIAQPEHDYFKKCDAKLLEFVKEMAQKAKEMEKKIAEQKDKTVPFKKEKEEKF